MKRINLVLALITSGLLSAPVAAQVGKKGEAPTTPTPAKTGTQPKKTTAPARPARSTTSTGRRTNSTPAKPSPANDTSVEVAYWETIKNSADPEDFRGYLRD